MVKHTNKTTTDQSYITDDHSYLPFSFPYIHVQCTLLFIFAVCTGVYFSSVHCSMLAIIMFRKSQHIYLYLVSINMNCTNNVDVTHCALSLICVFCFATMYVVFGIHVCVSLYFGLLPCSFQFSSQTSMNKTYIYAQSVM